MAEREIKTVLTLEDASFSKGLKAATSGVSAAKAEMQAAISSAGGLGKGFKQAAAQIKGLSNVVKAQKNQMGVLSKEYSTQKARLNDLKKAAEAARKENGEGSKEAEKAANAYASQSAKVDDLRVKMANLTVEMNKSKDALKDKLTQPLQRAGAFLKSFGKLAAGAFAAGGAALVKFTIDSNESKKTFNTSLTESRGAFGKWSLFLEEEAKKAWKNLGLSQSAYLETASQIGAALQKGGMGVQQSAEWVTQAMELAGQLSEKYGVPVETVLNDIAKAAEGDTTALNRYGVEVKGINKEMSESDKAAATLKEAMNSAGESAKLLDGQVAQSVDNSGEKFKAAWENFKAGVGSSEDVAAAAAEAASSFGSQFAANLGTFIKIAPGTLSAFGSSFSEGWKADVWPQIQNLFSEQFHVDLPDWETLKSDISQGWETLKANIAGFFEKPFGIDLPDPQQIITDLTTTWATVKQRTAEFFKKPFGIDIPSLADIMQGLTNLWTPIQERITSFFEKPFDIQIPTIGDITKHLSDLWNGIKEWWNKNVTSLFITVQEKVDQFNSDTEDIFRFYPNGFAGGLWNVPRNDYMARLHTGEMVLTASQAAAYRAQAAAGGNVNNYNDSSAIYIDKYYQNSETDAQALLNAMSVMQRRQRRGYGMA